MSLFRLRRLFDQLLQVTKLEQQQLIGIEPLSLLALQRLQQFFDRAFALLKPLLLSFDGGCEFDRLLLRDDHLRLT